MEFDQEMLALLACPKCKGPLQHEGDALICPSCRLMYSIRNGIPVLLVDEAETLSGE